MQSIHIGTNIAHLRKEMGLTQEAFADYLGVSKPAVSKWESGKSYPDLSLLPIIAAYFNKSVDELIGYEPQMPAEDIKKLYIQLADAFAKEPFTAVYARCRKTIKKYYSCWPLLFSMAELLVNHATQADDPAKTAAIYEEAAALFKRVEQNSRDPVLARMSLSMRAYCALARQQPKEAVDLLGNIEEPLISTNQLLAKAYAMQGDSGRAKEVLQKELYQTVLSLFTALADLMQLYTDDPEQMNRCLQRTLDFGNVFALEKLHPASYFSFYLTTASLYVSIGQNEQALKLLEAYTDLVTRKGVFPLRLKGDAFFDRLEPYFASLNLGSHAPRSDILIRRDLKTTVTHNPVFQALQNDHRFQRIRHRLDQWEAHTP
jgi:transcriptional regulator with XRE-family HTH domain